MSGLALAEVRPPAQPARRAVVAEQLAGVRLPERSVRLLGAAGLGPRTPGAGRDDVEARSTAAAGRGLRRLVAALCDGADDGEACRGAVAGLVGLGPGLTPTGDDLMVAVLATARRLSADHLLPGAAASRLADVIAEVGDGRTTPVADRMRAEAVLGRYPEPLARVVGALGDPDAGGAAFDRLAGALVATGAHSGADWFAGVVALARACLGRRGGR